MHAQHTTVVRSSCIAPVNTQWWSDHRALHQSIRNGGQIIVHCTSQHTTVVRSSCIAPVNTQRWSGHRALHQSTHNGGQIIVHCTSQHTTVVRSKAREERGRLIVQSGKLSCNYLALGEDCILSAGSGYWPTASRLERHLHSDEQ